MRTTPKCVFIDLGAANGNSFATFREHGFVNVSQCPSGGLYEAWLVEANPNFNAPLQNLEEKYSGAVHALSATAAWNCQGSSSFNIDDNPVHNHWGSSLGSMDLEHDQQVSKVVTVPTVNVIQMIHEHTLPEDYVVVKMDIEGAEWDLLPCLAQSDDRHLVDIIFMERHSYDRSLHTYPASELDNAVESLKTDGVAMPVYSSPT